MFFVVDDDTMFRMTVSWGELFDKIIETLGKRRCGPWSTEEEEEEEEEKEGNVQN